MVSPALLDPTEPPPVEICNPTGAAPILLTCDHASRAIPRALEKLGLTDDELARHIGWDIGAAAVTRHVAPLLDAPALLAGYSRLVIDCNRPPEDPSSIPAASDGVVIPGNAELPPQARLLRRQSLFEPYHAAITARLAALRRAGIAPALISIHSFTPSMGGRARPWHVGVLWDQDGRIALPLLESLRMKAGLVVGDNEPYSAREPAGYTQRHHGLEAGLPHVAIELRQDLVAAEADARGWAERLARLLRPILTRDGLDMAIAPPAPHS